jgi:hypothetical protein
VLDLFAPPPGTLKRFEGPMFSRAGAEISAVPDLQGDGLDDLAIAAPGSGRVYVALSNDAVFNGSNETQPGVRSPFPRFDIGRADGTTLFALNAAGSSEHFIARTVGDVNGDGRVDIASRGICTATDAAGICSENSQAIVFARATGVLPRISKLNGKDGFVMIGARPPLNAEALSGGSDVDGDLRQDLSVRRSDGSVLLIYGQASPAAFPAFIDINKTPSGYGTEYGFYTSTTQRVVEAQLIGDINGDGRGDLAIVVCVTADVSCSDSGGSFNVQVVFGRVARPKTINIGTLPFPAERALFNVPSGGGRPLLGESARLGDVGGDSNGDFLVKTGALRRVVYGRASFPVGLNLGTLGGTDGFSIAGLPALGDPRVVGIGRFTGGTKDDLALTFAEGIRPVPIAGNPPEAAGQVGHVQIYRGRTSAPAATITLGSTPVSQLGPRFIGSAEIRIGTEFGGRTVTSADLNGDGKLELFVGAMASEGRETKSGVIAVINGLGTQWTSADFNVDYSQTLPKLIISGERDLLPAPNGAIGTLVRVLGDWDGDGKPEIVVEDSFGTVVRGSAID